MAEWVTNVPNSLTFARIVLAVPMVMTYRHGLPTFAFVIFGLSCLSDYVDGWWARRFHAETEWGRKADPIADKVAVYSVFLVCFEAFGNEWVFIAATITIAMYDAAVIWMRTKLENMKTGRVAKWKTFVLMVACTVAFLSMTIGDIRIGEYGVARTVAIVLFAAASVLAIVSVAMYYREHHTHLLRHSPVPAK